MDWTNQSVIRFLELYRTHPCIWDKKNVWYKNRKRRQRAWLEVKHNLGEPCSIKELKHKRASLMSAYRAYRCKIKKSEGSGHVYKPTWYAYSVMDSFLSDVYNCNPLIKTEDDHYPNDEYSHSDQDYSIVTHNTKHTSNLERTPSPVAQTSMPQRPLQTSKAVRFKRSVRSRALLHARKQMDQALDILKTVSQKRNDEDECDVYGELIAKKMRNLAEDRRELMMIRINQLFYEEHLEQNGVNSTSP